MWQKQVSTELMNETFGGIIDSGVDWPAVDAERSVSDKSPAEVRDEIFLRRRRLEADRLQP
jgi:hypothetical protein